MVKRICIVLFVLAILVTGYLSFKKLNYWDRSVMIFKYDSSQQFNRGRGGRGFGESEGREGNARREFREGMQRPGGMNRPDRGAFPGGTRVQTRNGGHDFRGGSNINLKTVLYYLGVFALFTVLAVYIEKGYRLIFKQKKLTKENSDLII